MYEQYKCVLQHLLSYMYIIYVYLFTYMLSYMVIYHIDIHIWYMTIYDNRYVNRYTYMSCSTCCHRHLLSYMYTIYVYLFTYMYCSHACISVYIYVILIHIRIAHTCTGAATERDEAKALRLDAHAVMRIYIMSHTYLHIYKADTCTYIYMHICILLIRI